MKKTLTTLVILVVLGFGASAQSLFQRDGGIYNSKDRGTNNGPMINLPEAHGLTDNQDGVPLGSGIAVLMGLGAAYLVGKKRK